MPICILLIFAYRIRSSSLFINELFLVDRYQKETIKIMSVVRNGIENIVFLSNW